MTDLHFSFEWEDPAGAAGPELAATWARLEVAVGGEPVTRVFDSRSKTVRIGVYVPLYPIAEWIASNWWRLLNETPMPSRHSAVSYREAHDLSLAGEGFALPRLSIEPSGESVRLEWQAYAHEMAGVEFINQGSTTVGRSQVEEALSTFVESVIQRLEALGQEGTVLSEEWASIQGADEEEEAFCKAIAQMGVDPYAADQQTSDAVLRTADRLPGEMIAEFFSVAEASEIDTDLRSVLNALDTARRNKASIRRLSELRGRYSQQPRTLQRPWETGYSVAKAFRDQAGLDGKPLQSLSSIGEALNLEVKDLESVLRSSRSFLRQIQAVVGYNGRSTPVFVIPDKVESARRFTFCRGLYEVLASTDASPALVTRARTDRQKENRAFAAELLLPSHALRERVKGGDIGLEEMEEIARDYAVSVAVVYYQTVNHGIARPMVSPEFAGW